MALKPSIHKFRIDLSDLDRGHYEALNLTVARHPSETAERMMVRVLAFCLDAQAGPAFTRGLSESDEAALWVHAPNGETTLWIDVGEPDADRIKKASRQARRVKVYSFNHKSPVWWEQNKDKLAALPVSVYRFGWPQVQALAALAQQRSTDLSLMVSGGTLHAATAHGSCAVDCLPLQEPE